jgi:indolepyruvate ferredoxin oxidoreductase beta subunit
MNQEQLDIFIIGVGGQGIGLLSECLIRAFDHAGRPVRGVDTHGLAQRGGTVVSNVRVGSGAHSPMVRPGRVGLVVALERHEAFRAMQTVLSDRGVLIYYDAEWQPLDVRLGQNSAVTATGLEASANRRGIRLFRVFEELPDTRMQNVAVLAHLARNRLLPGVDREHIGRALMDLLAGETLDQNLALFRRLSA